MNQHYNVQMISTAGTEALLHNCDCVDGIGHHIAPGSVDVVITSPPYNLGIDYRSYDDSISRSDYLDWTREWAKQVAVALAPDGSFFLNVGSKPRDPWVALDVAATMRERFTLQNVIHWVKSIAISREDVGSNVEVPGDIAVGHYKPINSRRYLNDCHEYIFHFTHSGNVPIERLAVGVPYQDKSNIRRWQPENGTHRDLRCRGNTWFIPYGTIQSSSGQRPHPATFPPKLPQMCIQLHGISQCNLVMDPFMGLGSTALACASLGVNFVGFEIDEFYFTESCNRIRQALTQGSIIR